MDAGDQTRQLAGLFSQMAAEVDDYRTEHFDELSQQQRTLLEETEDHLADVHDQLIAIAIDATLGSLTGDLNRISAITREAKQTIQHLKQYQDVIKIASAAVEVGTAALSGDAGMIASSIEDLTDLLPKN